MPSSKKSKNKYNKKTSIRNNWCLDLPSDIIYGHIIPETALETVNDMKVFTEDSCTNLQKMCADPTCEELCWNAPADIKNNYINVCKEIIKTKRCISGIINYSPIRRSYLAHYITLSQNLEILNEEIYKQGGLYNVIIGFKSLPKKAQINGLTKKQKIELKKIYIERDSPGDPHMGSYNTMITCINVLNIPQKIKDIFIGFFIDRDLMDTLMDEEEDENGEIIIIQRDIDDLGLPINNNMFHKGNLILDIEDGINSFFELGAIDIYELLFQYTTGDRKQDEYIKQQFLLMMAYLEDIRMWDNGVKRKL